MSGTWKEEVGAGGPANGDVEKYQFEVFELFPKQRILSCRGERLPLMPKPLETLVLLVEHAGRTVSKEVLLAEVWKGASVEENNLTQSISALRKALGEKRGENRFIVTDPGHGYRFVAPVSRIVEPMAVPATPPTGRHSNRIQTFSLLIAGFALISGTGYWLTRHPAIAGSPVRRSVAVLRIRDLSKMSTEAWLQTALSEMLTSELAAGGKLRTIPSEDVDRWRSDLGPAAEHARQAELFQSAQRNLGADALVVGSYLVTGSCPNCTIRVDLGVMNAASGERFGTVIEEGSATDLTDLTSRLGRRLRAEFGIIAPVPVLPRWPAASAMREYAEGLKSLRHTDPMAAREHLQNASDADPGNALIHSALAETWNALGYGARANEENKRAYEMSGSLDRLDRLGVEARYRVSLAQWDRAIEIYKTIFQLFPDSLEDGLNLARAQVRAGRGVELNSTLAMLRKLPAPAGNDPRVDMAEAQMAGTMNDYPRTRDLAHRAAEEARRRGALYQYARARLLEGGATQNLSYSDAAARLQTEARQVCEQIGDRECVSKTWRIEGNRLFYYGDFDAARQAYGRGIAIARDLGNRTELANLLTGFGAVAEADRRWTEAEADLREAIALRIETGYNPAEVQVQLAELYIALGRFPDAAKTLERAYLEAQRAAATEELGDIFRLQSIIARSNGELDRAQQLSQKAVSELRKSQGLAVLTVALANASSIATLRGDLAAAERDITAANAGTGSMPLIEGMVSLARAELRLAQKRFQEAASDATAAAASFDKAHEDEQAARAFLAAADAQEMLNRAEDGLQACRESEARAQRSPRRSTVVLGQLCEWRLGGYPERPPNAKTSDPEFTLAADYAVAMHARRIGDRNTTALFNELAHTASIRGYVTMANRAQLLAGDHFNASSAR